MLNATKCIQDTCFSLVYLLQDVLCINALFISSYIAHYVFVQVILIKKQWIVFANRLLEQL